MPAIGLVLAALSLRWLARCATPSTADEYIRNFHEPSMRLALRPVPGRILASVASLGTGGSLGYEGPSIYMGAAAGTGVQERWGRFFRREDRKILMVAGAAAGVPAIFKAPATGTLFAMEVPYQGDFAAHATLPALVSSASAYVAFALIESTRPLLRVAGVSEFTFSDILVCGIIGLACGLGARVFARLIEWAKDGRALPKIWLRILVGGTSLAVFAAIATQLYGEPLTLGPGYAAIEWATRLDHEMLLLLALFVLQGAATIMTLFGGGVGGVFIPLVVQGALLGTIIGEVVSWMSPGFGHSTLFPMVGAAAFLGAGYRTPLAAAVFVAEATGRPGAVVPGLIATAIAQLMMGDASVSPYIRQRRMGHLERPLRLSVTAAMDRDVQGVSPDTTVEELLNVDMLMTRESALPVLEGRSYLGMVRLGSLAEVGKEERSTVKTRDVMETGLPVARTTWSLRRAVAAMEDSDIDCLAVLSDGTFEGLVTIESIVRLDQVLEAPPDH